MVPCLILQVTCSGAHALAVAVSVPVAVPRAELWLPLGGAPSSNVTIVEGARGQQAVVYRNGMFAAVPGIGGVAIMSSNAVVTVGSGSYLVTLHTK